MGRKTPRRGYAAGRGLSPHIKPADSTRSLALKRTRPAPTVDLVGLRERLLEARRRLVERIAITQGQIREYDLPTKPPKKSTHSKTFTGGTVEIEALPVSDLLELVGDCIERHIDPRHLEVTRIAERSERALLEGFLVAYRKGDLDGVGGAQ